MAGDDGNPYTRLAGAGERTGGVDNGGATLNGILEQGCALVRAIGALGTIDPTGPFERALVRLLMAASTADVPVQC